MNASFRKGQQNIRDRRRKSSGKDVKRSLRNVVAEVAPVREVRKAVTTALRNGAKKLRESGALGAVRTRVETVATGVRSKVYRYTRAQVEMIVTAYKPRKDEYRQVRVALLLAFAS